MKGRRKSVIHKTFSDDSLMINKSFKSSLLQQLKTLHGEDIMARKVQHLPIKQLVKQKNFMYAGGFAALLIVAVGIFALDNRSTNLASQKEIKDIIALPQNLDDVLGVNEMRTLAANDAPQGATVSGIEIENEDGVILYKVKFSDGSFRLYDAKTGLPYEKTSDGSDDLSEVDESVPAGFVAGITVQQARDIAQAQRPGKTITSIELETEDGVVVYSVKFSDGWEVYLNSSNGAVIEVEAPEASRQDQDDSDDDQENEQDEKNDSDDKKEDEKDEDTQDDNDRSGSNSGSSNDDRR